MKFDDPADAENLVRRLTVFPPYIPGAKVAAHAVDLIDYMLVGGTLYPRGKEPR